ncbi:MAG: type II secretion system protein [Erysipelotrichaceae bacterium]|nr:type II secretion system protein [Erysipelotrichaceae bacterium]
MIRKGKKDGFTLAELLVVVAIIGILIAVSIPIFSSQTTKAKAATDMANVRAAKAAAVVDYLSSGSSGPATYYYDASKGTITTKEEDAKIITGYGKSTSPVSNATGTPYDNGTAHIVSIYIADDRTQIASWVLGTGGGNTGGGTLGGGDANPDDTNPSTKLPNAFNSSVSEWNKEIENKSSYDIVPGKVYSDNGKIYFGVDANPPYHLNGWDLKNINLDVLTGWYATDKYTGKIWNSSDFSKERNDVNRGDLCKVGDNYYVYKDGGNTTSGPDLSSGQWQKINLN